MVTAQCLNDEGAAAYCSPCYEAVVAQVARLEAELEAEIRAREKAEVDFDREACRSTDLEAELAEAKAARDAMGWALGMAITEDHVFRHAERPETHCGPAPSCSDEPCKGRLAALSPGAGAG